MPAPLPASPPDIASILTSLGVFSLAVAAVVGGIYKGLQEVKKGGAKTDAEVAAGVIMGSSSVTALIDSNLRATEATKDLQQAVERLDRRHERLVEALHEHREMTRSQLEEQHRLRAATADLVEIMRRKM